MMQDRITQILQQMNEMSDEPIRMQDGGTVDDNTTNITNPFTQVYGQRRSTPLSMDEYLSGSMYDFAGINVAAAPDIDDDDDDDDDDAQAAPSVLTPVSERTDDPSQVFRAISQGGQLGTGYRVSAKDPSSYLDDLLNAETFTVKEDGFSKYAQQKFKEGGGIPTTVAGLAMGNPALTVLGAGAAALAEKQNKKNAEAILQTGGGDLFDLNGATVSRAPGERIFTGNLGGFSQEQLYAAREMDFGFIPGTMREVLTEDEKAKITSSRTGLGGVKAAGSVSGHIMDAFGTIHGVRDSDGGQMQVGAIAAQRMRENEFRSVMAAQGIDVNKQFTDGAGNFSRSAFTRAAVDYKQFVDGKMKTHPSHGGFFHKTSNLSPNAYASAMAFRDSVASRFVNDTYSGVTTAQVTGDPARKGPDPKVPPPLPSRPIPVAETQDRDDDDSDGPFGTGYTYDSGSVAASTRETQENYERESGVYGGGGGGSDPDASQSAGLDRPSDGGGRSARDMDMKASGGRVGMAAGDTPQGTFEPGFVKGPPENFTERETVADDQNGKVKPDTFIINAAAVEIAGSEDIRNMLMKAYEVAVQKGLDIGRVDRKLYEGTVDVALSKGEVVVPPELAKIIGYDRLRKINNRGKKEVASRQKKAGGGFLNGKKFAEGGEADYEDRIIADEVRRKMQELLGELPDDITVTFDAHRDNPKFKERIQKEADAMGMLPLAGHYYSNPKTKTISVPQTPTLFNLYVMAEEIAHQDYLSRRQENPYKGFSGFVDENNRKFGSSRDAFDHYEAFEREQRYLEEMRAKSIAYETVKDLLPKGKKTAEYFRQGYEEDFARYIYDTAPELIRKGIYDKYQELQKYVDDKGRFVSHKKK